MTIVLAGIYIKYWISLRKQQQQSNSRSISVLQTAVIKTNAINYECRFMLS